MSKDKYEVSRQKGIQDGLRLKYRPTTPLLSTWMSRDSGRDRDAYDRGFGIGRKSRR